jgi:hypothetical protein
MALNLEQQKLLSKAQLLGAGTALPVTLSEGELLKLICVILTDVDRKDLIPDSAISPALSNWNYYDIGIQWFIDGACPVPFAAFYERCISEVRDFETYFKCVCELHKRRRKYEMILCAQPLPTALQIAPRSLLEFCVLATPALASWLTWRKWFYDIDNRAAQETGYLFEPILANALGGAPYGAKASPVRRRSDPKKGRQVDCIVGTDAYEFKLRVTIAASGQGRFGEELDFAEDCVASGLRPILLVLDPTPSPRLDDLAKAFRQVGGEAHIGTAAWEYLEARSGPTMATFIEKYVRRPISMIDDHMEELLDLHISTDENRREFRVALGDVQWRITRHEDPTLEVTPDEE